MATSRTSHEKACMSFPGIDGVKVCVAGDAGSGNVMSISYILPGFTGIACSSCDRGKNSKNLDGDAKRVFDAIDAFLNHKLLPDLSMLDLEKMAAAFKTPFSRKVIDALLKTRAGQTITYKELATQAGSPGAARAVGNVMRSNPFPIIIPCHRVISPKGLGGYSGDVRGTSLQIKQKLLDIEASMT
nr:MGMT family protein [Candidatus Sigynarchaeota archaeon]